MTHPTPTPTPTLPSVLLVEDNEDHRDLTLEALEAAGLEKSVYTAATAQEARAYLKESVAGAGAEADQPLSLILLDIRLPDGSGLEVLRDIKREPLLRAVPVVVLTTSDDRTDIEMAYHLGADDYLVKPVHFEEFLQKIKQAALTWLKDRLTETA